MNSLPVGRWENCFNLFEVGIAEIFSHHLLHSSLHFLHSYDFFSVVKHRGNSVSTPIIINFKTVFSVQILILNT